MDTRRKQCVSLMIPGINIEKINCRQSICLRAALGVNAASFTITGTGLQLMPGPEIAQTINLFHFVSCNSFDLMF